MKTDLNAFEEQLKGNVVGKENEINDNELTSWLV